MIPIKNSHVVRLQVFSRWNTETDRQANKPNTTNRLPNPSFVHAHTKYNRYRLKEYDRLLAILGNFCKILISRKLFSLVPTDITD